MINNCLKVVFDESPTELVALTNDLSPDITEIDLSGNALGYYDTEEIVAALASIPPGVIKLNLGTNDLDQLESQQLLQVVTAIPKTISYLDLSTNGFRKKGVLKDVLAAIPEGVTALCLNGNFIGLKEVDELALAFTALSPNVIELSLCGTLLDKLSIDDMKKLKNSLPHVRKICLEYTDIGGMSHEQLDALADIFPNLEEVALTHNNVQLGDTDLRERANILRKIGFKAKVPALVNQCAFFITRSSEIDDISSLPSELQEKINLF